MTVPSITCPNCGTAIVPESDLPPTRRQWQVLVFIYAFIKDEGYPPSLVEIADGIGRTTKSGASDLIKGLKRRKLIDYEAHRARTISLTEAGTRYATRYQT